MSTRFVAVLTAILLCSCATDDDHEALYVPTDDELSAIDQQTVIGTTSEASAADPFEILFFDGCDTAGTPCAYLPVHNPGYSGQLPDGQLLIYAELDSGSAVPSAYYTCAQDPLNSSLRFAPSGAIALSLYYSATAQCNSAAPDFLASPPIQVVPIPSAGPMCTEVCGDANQDGTLNIIDASTIVAHVVGNIVLASCGLDAADLNGDGAINIFDASAAVALIVGNPVPPNVCSP